MWFPLLLWMFLGKILQVLGLDRDLLLRLGRSYQVFRWIVIWGKPDRFCNRACDFPRGLDICTMVELRSRIGLSSFLLTYSLLTLQWRICSWCISRILARGGHGDTYRKIKVHTREDAIRYEMQEILREAYLFITCHMRILSCIHGNHSMQIKMIENQTKNSSIWIS